MRTPPQTPRDIGFGAVLLLGALATGAAVDFALWAFGVRLPPVFTVLWGVGAVLLLCAAATSKRRKRVQDDRPGPRLP